MSDLLKRKFGSINNRLKIEGIWVDDKLIENVNMEFSPEFKSGQLKQFEGELDEEQKFSGKNCTLKYQDGTIYQGSMEKGQRQGRYGSIISNNGELLANGEWKSDQLNGYVTRLKVFLKSYYDAESGVSPSSISDSSSATYTVGIPVCTVGYYTGLMNEGSIGPIGSLYLEPSNLLFYEGQWANNFPHGRGTMLFQEGIFEGNFRRGLREGDGYMKIMDTDQRLLTIKGIWRDDMIVYLSEVIEEQILGDSLTHSSSPASSATFKSLPLLSPMSNSRKIDRFLRSRLPGEARLTTSVFLTQQVEFSNGKIFEPTKVFEKDQIGFSKLLICDFWKGHSFHSNTSPVPVQAKMSVNPSSVKSASLLYLLRIEGLVAEARSVARLNGLAPFLGYQAVCTFAGKSLETDITRSTRGNSVYWAEDVDSANPLIFQLENKTKKKDLFLQVYGIHHLHPHPHVPAATPRILLGGLIHQLDKEGKRTNTSSHSSYLQLPLVNSSKKTMVGTVHMLINVCE